VNLRPGQGREAAIDAQQVADRLASVRERIRHAGGTEVAIVGVTKTWGIDAVRIAAAVGCDAVGENYAQEMITKFAGQVDLPPVHFIGRLQTNKVRSVAAMVDMYETVDRVSLATEIGARTGEPGRRPGQGRLRARRGAGAGRHVPRHRAAGRWADDGRPDRGGSRSGEAGLPWRSSDARPTRPESLLDGDERRPRGRGARRLHTGESGERIVRSSTRGSTSPTVRCTSLPPPGGA
jgi:hypothetical protein